MAFIHNIDSKRIPVPILLLLLLTVSASISECIALPLNDTGVEDNELLEVDIIDLTPYAQRMFGQPNSETGNIIENIRSRNPEELGNYLEGDILVPNSTYSVERNGILTQSSRWTGGIVPYTIEGKFNTREMSVLQNAINEYHKKTCIRFRQRTSERDYVAITNEKTGCWSAVGRLGGRQEVNLQAPSCLWHYGTSIHELMHAVGFFHEQNRYERDGYVRIITENVETGRMINFDKISAKAAQGFGVPYDYASVMHYSANSFSVNGKPTIVALRKTKEAALMGQRSSLSAGDVQKINQMYRCK